jgi:protein O-mannosyl-transferase
MADARLSWEWFGLALVLITTFIVYWPALKGAQLWDDDAHITKPELRSLHGLARIWFEPGNPATHKLGATQQYYPLLHSAFWLEHKLWGDSVLGYHLVNVLLHMTSVTLLYFILKRLKIPGALFAAAIFAVHPVMVESVAWISEQKNTLSAMLYLSAMLVYLGFDESRKFAHYYLALGLFVLGLLTKTVTATLPAALLVIFWWQRGRLSFKQDIRPLLPFFILGAAFGLLTAWIERTLIGAEGADFELSFLQRGLLAGRVVWFYLAKLLWPGNLIFIYPRWEISTALWWQWLFPIATIGVFIALWLLRSKTRAPLAGWLLFVGTLAPVLGFLNVYPFIYSFVADHFQYLASLGIIVLLAALVTTALSRLPYRDRWIGAAIPVFIVFVLAALTFEQCRMYASPIKLYQTTIAHNPDSWMAHNNLGSALQATGDHQGAMEEYRTAIGLRPNCAEAHSNLGYELTIVGRLDEAIAEQHAALAIKPNHPLFLMNLSLALIKADRKTEAVEKLEMALKKNPDDAITHDTLGYALIQLGRYPEAKEHLQKALEIMPLYAEAHQNMAAVLKSAGQTEQAIDHLKRSLEIYPGSANAHLNLALLLAESGKFAEACTQYEEALRLRPNNPEAHKNLADILLGLGQLPQALQHAQAALQLQPNYIQAYGIIARALANLNRPAEALATAEKAIQVAKATNQQAEIPPIEGWVQRLHAELKRVGAENNALPQSKSNPPLQTK